MGNTGAQESLDGIPCRSFREDPPPINPVIPAAGGADTVSASKIDYVARWARYDTEGCILRALEDGEIELFYRDRLGYRSCDTYRLTAKGRRAYEDHIRGLIEMSGEATGRAKEELQRKAQDGPASAAEPEPAALNGGLLGRPSRLKRAAGRRDALSGCRRAAGRRAHAARRAARRGRTGRLFWGPASI